jgi:uncharacterized paraquat-inducible protein A
MIGRLLAVQDTGASQDYVYFHDALPALLQWLRSVHVMSQGRQETTVRLGQAVGDFALGLTAFFVVAALAYVALSGIARKVFGPDAGSSGVYVLLALMAGWHSTRSTLALRNKQRRESSNAQRDALLRSGLCPTCDYDLTGNISGTCPECGTPVEAEQDQRPGDAGDSPAD